MTEALRRLAETYPLVILTNTDDDHAPSLVEHLGAPVEVVVTAEQAQAYKPRLRAFEYMLEKLGVEPDEIVHVSSSPSVRPPPGVRRRHHEQGVPRPRVGAGPAVVELHPHHRHRRPAGAIRPAAPVIAIETD